MNYQATENPWQKMEISTQRRVDIDTPRNFFWMTDLQGNYGFYLKRKEAFNDTDNLIKLNGISILKRNSDKNVGEFFLILHRKEDWQIFQILCEDLIAVSHHCDTDEQMFDVFENRFEQWKNLLSET